LAAAAVFTKNGRLKYLNKLGYTITRK